MVAWEAAVPGTPNNTDGMVSDVLVTEISPIMTANAFRGSRSSVNGSRMASPTSPPRPGMAPRERPMTTPRDRKARLRGIRSKKHGQPKMFCTALRAASHIGFLPLKFRSDSPSVVSRQFGVCKS